jgi:aspartyl-tRNA(Asn)/glutamyl-tRNA(Gln) amidotransferase subunit C
MSKLTHEDVLKLAHLARLSLSDTEVTEFQKELNDILQYVDQLQEVDVDELKPTSQVTGLVNVTRRDEIGSYGYEVSDLMTNVPATQDGHIKVKRMIG